MLATRKHMNVELRFKKIQSFVYGIRQHIGRKLVVICCLCHIEVDRWQLKWIKKRKKFYYDFKQIPGKLFWTNIIIAHIRYSMSKNHINFVFIINKSNYMTYKNLKCSLVFSLISPSICNFTILRPKNCLTFTIFINKF